MRLRLFVMSLALIAGPAEARTIRCTAISRATIEHQFTRFNQALASRDADRVTALFAPDAVLLPTLSDEERTTPAAIRAYFEHFLEKAPVGHIDTSTIRIGCNDAMRVGNWTFDLTDPKTHAKSAAHARYTFVYRYSGGRWSIEHLHSSLMPGGH
jgi:uncharacterized protein (TIGR02246 family)